MKKSLPIALLLLASCAEPAQGPAPFGPPSGQETVLMISGGFAPASLSVTRGESVCFRNEDAEGRWPASNDHPTHALYPAFDPGIPVMKGRQWCFAFDRLGTWEYHDHLFPEVKGRITVE